MFPDNPFTSGAAFVAKGHPSAPRRLIHVNEDPFRPQPRLDRDAEDGMATVVGRLRKDDVLTPPSEVADAIVGICSGLMDALGGQVVTVDRGAGLYENFSRLYQERNVRPIVTRRQP